MPVGIVTDSFIAGILASFACGLGALPLIFPGLKLKEHSGLGYALAGGLMFAASVYNLLLPGLSMTENEMTLRTVIPVISGILAGALFIWATHVYLEPERFEKSGLRKYGKRIEILIFVAMSVHSIPEGVAVGVGYASGEVLNTSIGDYIALAIAIHNIPEGLAVAIPLRAAGASIHKCFWAAFFTSLPQPIAALPASLASWFFQPLMPILMGFAAGAMIYLVIMELIPEALEKETPVKMAWFFTSGFCGMILVQVVL